MTEARRELRESAPDSVPLIEDRVRPEWVGGAGRMTAEHYAANFAWALTELLATHLSLGPDAGGVKGTHVAVLQNASHYLRPLRKGDQFNIEARMLGWTPVSMHVFFTMWHESDIAATCEQLLQNTSDAESDPTPFPDAAAHAIERLYENQAGLPPPPQAGKSIELTERA